MDYQDQLIDHRLMISCKTLARIIWTHFNINTISIKSDHVHGRRKGEPIIRNKFIYIRYNQILHYANKPQIYPVYVVQQI